ncbi:ATP-binding protein [Hyphomicrobium sp.]|uniref:ATP-binding protein n=1 Tax=Hyphomicrobium sp. TaxID=82 RepID=UPI002D77DE54|nr:ATP-binding protein [Hyphomicrobium sp.]HET6388562.1 ATP-binding protein [Hyphomicrobium sp.]
MSQEVVSEPAYADRMARIQSAPIWLTGPAFVAAYVLLAWLSIISSAPSFGIVSWSPEIGLAFAALLVFGAQFWPWPVLAVAASNVVLRELPFAAQLLSPLIIGGGYALAISWLQQSRWRIDVKLTSLQDILTLEATAIVSSALVAIASILLLRASDVLPPSEIAYNIFRYGIGDLIGISIIAPFALVMANERELPKLTLEAAFQGIAIVAALVLAFGFANLPHFRLFNVLFFPIIWISLRHGLKGATYGLLGTEIGLLIALLMTGPPPASLTTYQSLMLVLAFTGLAIGGLVTERRRIEQTLRLNQGSVSEIFRLGSAGEVTTAIAHELNQPLTAISNYSRVVQDYLVKGEGDRSLAIEAATKVASQVDRTAAVVRSLRDLIRLGRRQVAEQHPALLVTEALDLLAPNLARAGAAVKVAIPRDIRTVAVDRLQIEQVLMNIISNAADAMSENEPARARVIHISASNTGSDRVEIVIKDRGPGFPAGFDLRKSGIRSSSKRDGLGVGLSLSQTIVEGHGGELVLENDSEGAVVRIRLDSFHREAVK